MSGARILVVDDKETMLSLFQRILPQHEIVTAGSGDKAIPLLESAGPFDVIVSDIRMPGLDGLALLKAARRAQPDIEVILMTAYGTVESAVQAMKAGAFDYLVKPFEPDEAIIIIEKALELRRLRQQAKSLREALDQAHGFGPFIGESEAMRRFYSLVSKASASDINVLILGESGTGKELAARTIHQRSLRKEKSFVAVNCGALPEALAESELFGHVKGSFTGAVADKPGLFEEAQEGTLFLDEVNSLPLSVQVKLNRALEEKEIRRVGSNKPDKIDVRLIAATNVDLKGEVSAGKFRDDLYFRLCVLVLKLPPLRERKEDIPLLSAHFMRALDSSRRIHELSPEALKALLAYKWPGNVRELRNAIESAIAVAETDHIVLADLPLDITGGAVDTIPAEHLARLTYQEACDLGRDRFVRQYLLALMKMFQGNVTSAAQHAGIERESLHRLLKKNQIVHSAFRKSD